MTAAALANHNVKVHQRAVERGIVLHKEKVKLESRDVISAATASRQCAQCRSCQARQGSLHHVRRLSLPTGGGGLMFEYKVLCM